VNDGVINDCRRLPDPVADVDVLRYARAVSLLTELNAFFSDHRRCDDLDADVDGPIAWIACDCGASMARRADEDGRAGPT
jgi:hypothetical protein